MKLPALYLTALCAAAAPALSADDSSEGVPFPGVESDPAGTVLPLSSAVSLIAGQVNVELSVRSADETSALMLNGPQFGWMGESEPYPDRQFPELDIRLDGAPVTPDERFEAFMGPINITNFIRSAEMDPWAITRTPPLTTADPNNSVVLKALKNVGAIQPSAAADEPGGAAAGRYRAKWRARRILRLPLMGARDRHVILNYRARPAFSTVTLDQLITPLRQSEYCISYAQMKSRLHAGSAVRGVAITEYTIPAGIDGKPAPTVTLTVAAPHASTFACGPRGKPIAAAGNLTRQPVQVDQSGSLHVLQIEDSR